MGPAGVKQITFPEVTFPDFPHWSGTNAEALVQGFVRTDGSGNLTLVCYLYDVAMKQELTRAGHLIAPSDWRPAAHNRPDALFARLSGVTPSFHSRFTFIASTRPPQHTATRLTAITR